MIKQFIRKARRIPSRAKRWGWKRVVMVTVLQMVESFQFWIWDVWHGVETRNQVALDDLGIEGACYGSHPADYVYSGWNGDYTCASSKFPEYLRRLNLDWSSFTYIDLGSGKGKSLLMAAELPFAKVIGVEFSERLVEAARRNLATKRNFNLKCQDIQVVLQDATAYEFPRQPLVIYLLNTFPPAIMRVVLDNLKRSLQQYPRDAYLMCIPTPPEVEALFAESGFLAVVDLSAAGNSIAGHRSYRAAVPVPDYVSQTR